MLVIHKNVILSKPNTGNVNQSDTFCFRKVITCTSHIQFTGFVFCHKQVDLCQRKACKSKKRFVILVIV